MSKQGLSVMELMITIVVMAIIATFSVIGVSAYLQNAKNRSFIENTNAIMKAAKDSYLIDPIIWADEKVTLKELIDNEHISLPSNDAYGGEYSLEETYVTSTRITNVSGENIIPITHLDLNSTAFDSYSILFSLRVVTSKATIGYDEPLSFYTTNDIVLLNHTETIIDRIVQSFDKDVKESFSTSDDHDEINIEKDIRNHTTVSTNGGDDIVNINQNLEYYSTLNTGDGNDSVNIDGLLRGNSNLLTGNGNDSIVINKNVQKGSIDTGSGDDTVVLDKSIYDSTVYLGEGHDSFSVGVLGKNTTVDTGIGNDIIDITNKMYLSILQSGDGNDQITVKNDVYSSSKIESGSGDDSILLQKSLNGSTVNSGSGSDSISLKQIRGNSYIITEDGMDIVMIYDVVTNFSGEVNLGSGDDELTITEERLDRHNKGTYNGGSGTDTLYLPDTTLSEWNNGAKDLFTNFETIVLEDTTLYN